MPSFDPRATWAFAIRFALLFALLLAPLPGLADAYTTAFARTTNAVLSVVDVGWRVGVRIEPPARLAAEGSWRAGLLLEDRETGRSMRSLLDVRSFSYRPMAMFVALAAASLRRGWRRNAIVFGGGLFVMAVVTTALAALALLSRFGAAGALGVAPGEIVRTLFQALATPVMVYAIALAAWGIAVRCARSPAGTRQTRETRQGSGPTCSRRNAELTPWASYRLDAHPPRSPTHRSWERV